MRTHKGKIRLGLGYAYCCLKPLLSKSFGNRTLHRSETGRQMFTREITSTRYLIFTGAVRKLQESPSIAKHSI